MVLEKITAAYENECSTWGWEATVGRKGPREIKTNIGRPNCFNLLLISCNLRIIILPLRGWAGGRCRLPFWSSQSRARGKFVPLLGMVASSKQSREGSFVEGKEGVGKLSFCFNFCVFLCVFVGGFSQKGLYLASSIFSVFCRFVCLLT